MKVCDLFLANLSQKGRVNTDETQVAESTDRAGHYNRKCDCEQCYRNRFPSTGTVQLGETKGTRNKQAAYLKTREKIDTK